MTTTNDDGFGCTIGCWIIAALLGVAVAAICMVGLGFSFMQGAFFGALFFVLGGFFISWAFCGRLARVNEAVAGAAVPAPAPAAAPTPAPTPAPAAPAMAAPAAVPAAAAPAPAAAPAASVMSAAPGEAVRPQGLSAPRAGGADDLKRIKGIGPKLEQLCHSLGYYHFDQIAAWTPAEVAWVDDNLEGFKGRVTRDTWVEQAKLLAAGGETAFSQRVDKGGVY